jgi:hypothetical protein
LVAIGGTPAKGLVVAGLSGLTLVEGGFNGSSMGGDVRVMGAELGVLIDWFPSSDDGWHVATGVGYGGLTLGTDPWRGRAAFATITGGYDFWIGPEWSLGVGIFATASTSAVMKNSSGDDTGYGLRMLSAGVSNEILFH